MKFRGYLGYNNHKHQFGLLTMDTWCVEAFEDGAPLQVCLDHERWINTRIELCCGAWHLAGTDYFADDLEGVLARVGTWSSDVFDPEYRERDDF